VILPRFKFIEPETLEEAFEIIEQTKGDTAFLAGGTDLLVNLKKKVVHHSVIISLEKLAELKNIEYSNEKGLTLGAMTRITDIEESPVLREKYPILAIAASKLGSPQVRNRATVGGNICAARPAGDTIGPLIAYAATVRLVSKDGERCQPLEEFFLGPGKTIIREGEILADIQLSTIPANTGASYIKYGIRKAMEIAVVSVTTLLTFGNASCQSARVVLGAVAPTFIRSPQAEEVLSGKIFSRDIAGHAAKLAADCCQPISDMRASAEYRRELVEVLTRRSLLEAASQCVNFS
jgi:CO/xanthine dehydrogenase FAD-binding subunit